jgi:hypothetical protein
MRRSEEVPTKGKGGDPTFLYARERDTIAEEKGGYEESKAAVTRDFNLILNCFSAT